MGFYLRKSVSAGPFRFNLSRSGVGLSVGVKGLRIGTGPRGNYVQMGRGGLYYRASLGGRRVATPTNARRDFITERRVEETSGVAVESGNVLDMRPSDGSAIVDQINEKMALLPLWPWPLAVGLCLLYIGSQFSAPVLSSLVLVLAIAATIAAVVYDKQRRAVVLMYDIEDDVLESYRRLVEQFETLRTARQVWNIHSSEFVYDSKRNAGAGNLLKRSRAFLTFRAPRVLRTNVSTPAIIGGRQSLYFLPDTVLILDGSKAGALSYDQVEVQWATTIFIESQGVPSDAKVVGTTWQYVNMSGGPDRRFSNNKQIPKCEYAKMRVTGANGLQKVLHLSKLVEHDGFDEALQAMRMCLKELSLGGGAHLDTGGLYESQEKLLVTERALTLEREKPKYWEYSLTSELLRPNLEKLFASFTELTNPQPGELAGKPLSPADSLAWLQKLLARMPDIANEFVRVIQEELPKSWGPVGVPAKEEDIRAACGKIFRCAERAVEWKTNVLRMPLPRLFAELKQVISTGLDPLMERAIRLPDDLSKIAEQEMRGAYEINVSISVPPDFTKRVDVAVEKVKSEVEGIVHRR